MDAAENQRIEPEAVIREYYRPGSKAYEIILAHGYQVALKAVAVAGRVPQLKPDVDFIHEAALLHDIGIFLTRMPELDCRGRYDYICHGYLGRELLEKKGLPKHALVCERHVGVGITLEDIRRHHFPLPRRDMCPVSVEEQIICYADKFFSKGAKKAAGERTLAETVRCLEKYGEEKVKKFRRMAVQFEGALPAECSLT